MKEIRLSAAGIIFKQGKVLLVRYQNAHSNFLVGPGGGVLPGEDLLTGLKREIFEETGLHVVPGKIVLVEDLLSSKYRVLKVWFLCSALGGELCKTEEARIEGITEVGWFGRDQLNSETVYPEILKNTEWKYLLDREFKAEYLPLKNVNF